MNDTHTAVDGLREACHDIRQSIAGVLALAGAALAEADLPDGTRNRLEQIIGLAEWQADVVRNSLDVTVPGGSGVAGRTDVVRVVNEAAATERLTWSGDLVLAWPPEPVLTGLQDVVLRRMAANLLANATRAAGPAGTVTIEVSRRNRRMLLAVEDDGPGFGRLAAEHGLGLSAVARQAIRHGGKLECGRGRLGGARVSLWLPVAAAQVKGGTADATCPV